MIGAAIAPEVSPATPTVTPEVRSAVATATPEVSPATSTVGPEVSPATSTVVPEVAAGGAAIGAKLAVGDTQTSQSINRAGGSKLRRAETGNKVPAPYLAAFLKQPQQRIQTSETAVDSFATGNLASQNAVSVEQLLDPRVCDLGLRGRRF